VTAAAITKEELQRLISRGPYHQWLGVEVLDFAEDYVEVKATWRAEWTANPDRKHTHGGILAALIDLGADWALAWRLGRAAPTIDMRVDYHRAAMPGDLSVKGRVVKFGSQFSVCEAQVLDSEGKLIASGRGTYFTGPLQPPKL
jgi:uncharacterized protein (TIGR00369 family)